jgi:hypothetical protein
LEEALKAAHYKSLIKVAGKCKLIFLTHLLNNHVVVGETETSWWHQFVGTASRTT